MENENTLIVDRRNNKNMGNSLNDKYKITLRTIDLLKCQIKRNQDSMKKLLLEIEGSCDTYIFQIDESIAINGNVTENLKHSVQLYNSLKEENDIILLNINDLTTNILSESLQIGTNDTSLDNDMKGLSILKAQEMERSRIACDLHDSVVQNLASMVHTVEYCIRTVDKDIVGAKLDLQIMMQSLRNSIEEIRTIIYNLRPMALDDLGLGVAIQRFADKLKESQNIHVEFINECNGIDIEDSVLSITLFRIVQEACSNAIKHGNASKITIHLSHNRKWICLNIKDNGSGFNISDVGHEVKKDNSGFGLSIMRERVELLSGTIQIYSTQKKGTMINVEVPVNKY